jgi:hypothetical protein
MFSHHSQMDAIDGQFSHETVENKEVVPGSNQRD